MNWIRMNIAVNNKSRARLEKLARDSDQSMSEVIRMALAVYSIIVTAKKNSPGVKLLITDKNGENAREIILPELQ